MTYICVRACPVVSPVFVQRPLVHAVSPPNSRSLEWPPVNCNKARSTRSTDTTTRCKLAPTIASLTNVTNSPLDHSVIHHSHSSGARWTSFGKPSVSCGAHSTSRHVSHRLRQRWADGCRKHLTRVKSHSRTALLWWTAMRGCLKASARVRVSLTLRVATS